MTKLQACKKLLKPCLNFASFEVMHLAISFIVQFKVTSWVLQYVK